MLLNKNWQGKTLNKLQRVHLTIFNNENLNQHVKDIQISIGNYVKCGVRIRQKISTRH